MHNSEIAESGLVWGMHFCSEDVKASQPGELWEASGHVGSDLAPAWPAGVTVL